MNTSDRLSGRGLYDRAQDRDSCGIALVAQVKGERSREIVLDALTALRRMAHRSACGCDEETGDGAGILVSLPHAFMARVAAPAVGLELPEAGGYGVAMVFLPRSEEARRTCRATLERFVRAQGQRVLGWRRVPTDASVLGPSARETEPVVAQLFVGAAPGLGREAFERQLYLIRKQAYHAIRAKLAEGGDPALDAYYVCSFSSRVVVYKGQLTPAQLPTYYADLGHDLLDSHVAIVHARFSTNTFPSWARAQPMRYMCHNGEINTLRGNANWMRARQGLLSSDAFGDELSKLYPVVDPETSDSGIFDNVLELLRLSGRLLPEAVAMMVPEAWEEDESMPAAKRAFYEYHASLMEPWDGPASVLFSDGRYAGAVLDRNGLRPSRYWVTHDDRVILASEVGVLDMPPESIRFKGRLQPGKTFLVDFEAGRVIADGELKESLAERRPYASWLEAQRLRLSALTPREAEPGDVARSDGLETRLRAFGYSTEHLSMLLGPMASQGKDPLGSMGNDSPLAVLSERPRLLTDYFKQLFAQVTNPAIDSIRERVVMSLACATGPEGNLLETTESQAQRLWLPRPILTDEEMAALKGMDQRGWRAKTIDLTFPRAAGERGLLEALNRICTEASAAILEGYRYVVLSDREAGPERVPVSALLATGAVHHHLVRSADRTRIGIAVESGEPREVHHFCLLVGYGADAIHPYLAFEAVRSLGDEIGPASTDRDPVAAYVEAAGNGMLKVMAKMGISTLASYKGAQIFEAVGLAPEVIDHCFAGTTSRLRGAGFEVLAAEALRRHAEAYPANPTVRTAGLPHAGEFHWRPDGERRIWNPSTIVKLQAAARSGGVDSYEEFARAADEEAHALCTLRGLLGFRSTNGPVPIEEVEPASEIVKRFSTGAMSFGALSREAHETLAVAMNRVGGRSNSGEGGEDAGRAIPLGNGDSRRSAIKQVASGRFGVTAGYLASADQIQIKVAQGAKPGEGGELPGGKVSEEIAQVRHTTPGVMLISPPPHHDIYSIEDLAQLIHDLHRANTRADVSVKLVAAVGVGAIAAGVAKARAEHIVISGHDGGTGASPLTSIRHAGLPWEMGIAEAQQALVANGLRSRVRLEVDGQLKTGRDVVVAGLLGAEEFGFSTAPLIAMGCIMMRKCHLNTCPVGVCTQDPVLRARFSGQPEHVLNYLFLVAEHARRIMASLGFRTFEAMIGRADMLHTDAVPRHWKSEGLDLSPLIVLAGEHESERHHTVRQDRGETGALEQELIRQATNALVPGRLVHVQHTVSNVDRAVGTTLSHEIVRRRGEDGLPDGTIHVQLRGSAGQSFGAWLAQGVSLELEGDANDYVGKGLSGGRIVVYPPRDVTFVAEENTIVGNVVLYGAVRGQAFIRGLAGERFAVRNSGALAVVEGVGDHGCEYMTGGRVVVLGPTGRNFAAGMSGGIAYVWDPMRELRNRCNTALVELSHVNTDEDAAELRWLIERHLRYTGSAPARSILADWERALHSFVKVIPPEYARSLETEQRVMSQVEPIAVVSDGPEPDDDTLAGAVPAPERTPDG